MGSSHPSRMCHPVGGKPSSHKSTDIYGGVVNKTVCEVRFAVEPAFRWWTEVRVNIAPLSTMDKLKLYTTEAGRQHVVALFILFVVPCLGEDSRKRIYKCKIQHF
jgi:hypothetical protein